MKNRYHIIILGGGVSGTLLALECRRKLQELDILIIEKSESFGQKIGESLNDIAAVYFRRYVAPEILKKHQPKSGLRYLFSSNSNGNTLTSEFDSPAYKGRNNGFHFNRKILDEDLLQKAISQGVDVIRPAEIIAISNEPFNYHVRINTQGAEKELTSERLIDATGRQRYLHRLFKWNDIKLELSTGAVSAYFKNVDWSAMPNGRSKKDVLKIINTPEFSTIHLMRKHSWWWIIRLDNETTSIGWVFDKKVHEYDSFQEKYVEQLTTDPNLKKLLKESVPFNIREVHDMPYCSEKLYDDGIILIGDSGGFTDPLLSPGMEYIVQQSIWISNLIKKDYQKGYNKKRWDGYQKKFIQSYRDRIDLYRFGYTIMDDPAVMITWLRAGSFIYFAFYGIPAIAFNTIKKPFQIRFLGKAAYRMLKWRLKRIYDKHQKLKMIKNKPYQTSGIKVPHNWTYIFLPFSLGAKWLRSQIALEFSTIGKKKQRDK